MSARRALVARLVIWFAAGALLGLAFLLDRPVRRIAAVLDFSIWDNLGEVVSSVSRVIAPVAILAAVAVAGRALRRPRLYQAVARAAVILILSGLLANGLKQAIGRERPWNERPVGAPEGPRVRRTNSFPSGHALAAFALAAALSGSIGRWRYVLYGYAGLVGAARLVVGAHWASDVVAGAMIGYGFGILGRHALRRSFVAPVGRAGPTGRALTRRQALAQVGLLASVALALFLLGNNDIGLIDRDEPRFAQCAREMVGRDDFVVPRFNGEYRFEKPPLSYWAMCGAYALAGQNEFGARLPSALWGVAACLLTYAIGLRLFDWRVAFLGAGILVSSLQMAIEAKAATADALLLALTLGALYAAIRLHEGGRALMWVPVLYGCLGLSNLAKGPVAIAVVGLGLATFIGVTRDRPFLRRLHLAPGLLILAAVNLPWLILVQLRTNGVFLKRIVQDHLLVHAAHGKEGHYAIFLVYLPLLLIFFFPWSILLPRALGRAWRERREDPSYLFLLSWVVPGFLVFCVVGTKLPHYLLPLYPGLALVVGRSLVSDIDAGRDPFFGRLGRVGVTGLILVAAGAMVGLPAILATQRFPRGQVLGATVPGILLLIGAVAGIRLMGHRRVRAGLAALMAAAYLAWMTLFHVVMPKVIDLNLSETAAPALVAARQQGLAVASVGYREPSLVWLTRGLPLLGDGEDLVTFAAQRGPGVALVQEEAFARSAWQDRLDLVEIGRLAGFNFAKWRMVKARLVTAAVRPPAGSRPASAPTAPPGGAAPAAPAPASPD